MHWIFGPRFGTPGKTFQRYQVILTEEQANRLATTCFRPTDAPLSGRIMKADFADLLFSRDLRRQIQENIEQQILCLSPVPWRGYPFRFSVMSHAPIGWTSAITKVHPLWSELHSRYLEYFQINKHANGYRVRPAYYDRFPAPLTSVVTMATTIRWNPIDARWNVFVETVYPGSDIGPLRAPHCSSRMIRDVKFWDWNAPGVLDSAA